MSKIAWPTLLAGCIGAVMASATEAQHHDSHHDVEELIVSAPMSKKESDISMPVNLLTGEELRESAADTLGETLKGLLGVTATSFGPGVGTPVIRGQSGNRVGVLQDGLGTLDASAISQDHANSVEPLLAERIEVIRGPATLLYGNGAIGGIVNVIDNRVPETAPQHFTAAAELRHNTVSAENAGVFKLDGGADSLAWHLDGLYRESGNVKIPGTAVDETAHPGEAAEGSNGFIENSGTASESLTAGGSFIGEHGFIGASISVLENTYGVPPGAHEHHEEGAAEAHTAADISIDMEQTRFNIKGGLQLDGFFESLEAHVAANDYEHKEIESDNGIEETGTVFSNKGAEARILLHHRSMGDARGVLGLQLGDHDFSAMGEESFIPASDIRALGLFAVETVDTGHWLYEFGFRVNNQSTAPGGNCDQDESTWSGSASGIWRFMEDTNLLFALSRSERSATVEELFSNIEVRTCAEPADSAQLVAHAASRRFEIGDPHLKTESSRNLELALRKHLGEIQGELNLFYNRIDDFIFLSDSGIELDATQISRYLQQDATFSGIEGEIAFPLETGGHHIDLSLFGDFVKAELDDGSNVPRIPPLRFGTEMAYLKESWSVKLSVTRAADQDRIASNESATQGYTLVDLYFDYHLQMNGSEAVVFIKGDNLLDEEIRNHTSPIKDFAPEPGIGFEIGLRTRF